MKMLGVRFSLGDFSGRHPRLKQGDELAGSVLEFIDMRRFPDNVRPFIGADGILLNASPDREEPAEDQHRLRIPLLRSTGNPFERLRIGLTHPCPCRVQGPEVELSLIVARFRCPGVTISHVCIRRFCCKGSCPAEKEREAAKEAEQGPGHQ